MHRKIKPRGLTDETIIAHQHFCLTYDGIFARKRGTFVNFSNGEGGRVFLIFTVYLKLKHLGLDVGGFFLGLSYLNVTWTPCKYLFTPTMALQKVTLAIPLTYIVV